MVTILLPRLREGDPLAEALAPLGRVVRVPLTLTVPGEAQALREAARRLAAGDFSWLVLTSARTVEALAPHLRALGEAASKRPPDSPERAETRRAGAGGSASRGSPGDSRVLDYRAASGHVGASARREEANLRGLRVAAVGPATARAWAELTGRPPECVAEGSAAALADLPDFAPSGASESRGCPTVGRCDDPGSSDASPSEAALSPDPHAGRARRGRRLLLPASALADSALAERLAAAGWQVERLTAYTTVAADPEDVPESLARAWRDGRVDAAILTSPSTARAVLSLLGEPPEAARMVAIGPTTARAARGLGLRVWATASSPTPAGVRDALVRALAGDGRASPGKATSRPIE